MTVFRHGVLVGEDGMAQRHAERGEEQRQF
ncbi:hypothetical protein BN874_1830007 [Candidatus Contendobacter odensis Run_B_J11]|uniref:Uncharacterized protein n=1 Tax=Candidatus Contendobacter odensis Run_B_J11 TaxID=1400861 RepID=A0A7U7J3Y6_9GAMM|nr:hypothetical protein BN874_1830007 [Candidatus Contendobacter odensis Run_B_J11]